MESSDRQSPALSLDVYSSTRAARYHTYHRRSLRARLTNQREQGNLLKALQLAAPLDSALDLPCGSGRFWTTFQRAGIRQLIAGDISVAMLNAAAGNRLSATLPAALLELSAFDIALPDDCVDVAVCLRFYHHLSRAEDRLRLLAELKRVTRRYVALSLWVDGNFRSWRAGDRFAPTDEVGFGKRICRPRAEVEAEFLQAGLLIRQHYDVWPRLDMWRLYLLELPDARIPT